MSRKRNNGGPKVATGGSATLSKGLEVLAAFATSNDGRTSAEVAEIIGHPRPTVARLAATLLHLGYLNRTARGRFEVAPRALTLGYPVLSRLMVRQRARPLMREFSERVAGSVSIAVPSDLDYVFVESIDIKSAMPHIPDIGFSSSLATTAIGRALLAAMTVDKLDEYVRRVERLRPNEWKQFGKAALSAVSDCRKVGFCTIRDTWRPQHLGVASPLGRTARGEALAINCAMASWMMNEEQVRESKLGLRLAGLASDLRAMMDLRL